ncbi:hypothetical protein AB0M44_38050 [Streptosporangium subroseum]|uniref:hypothetical protein n=1 Tax=Streptosporangium subroseum TaxID=106412 RepID=UPI0034370AC0
MIFVCRLLAGAVRLLWRHPIASMVVAVPCALAWLSGWQWGVALVVLVLLGLTAWALIDRASFVRLVGQRLLAWWRLVWVYRRHWQPVMFISGLGRTLKGRDYVPHLVGVRCTSWADLVTVKMLTGQSVKDWSDRIEHLEDH